MKNKAQSALLQFDRHQTVLAALCVTAVLSLSVLPLLIMRGDYILQTFDGLDSYPGFCAMLNRTGLFYAVDSPTPVMGGLSTLYVLSNYTLLDFLCHYFGFLNGVIINRTLSAVGGYFGMWLLLKKVVGKEETAKSGALVQLAAVGYAVAPLTTGRALTYAALPYLVCIFWHYAEHPRFDAKCLLLLFVPLLLTFSSAGIFILGFWFVGMVVCWILQRRPNANLLLGFVLMCAASVLCNIKVFLMMLSKTELNRSVFSADGNFGTLLRAAFLDGFEHCASTHRWLILPVCAAALLWAAGRLLLHRGDDAVRARDRRFLLWGGVLFAVIVLFCLLYALEGSGLLHDFISRVLPLLNGFNWGRVAHFDRLLWYVLFCMALVWFATTAGRRLLAFVLAGVQLCLIILTPGSYNDIRFNLKNVFTSETPGMVSYNEFFSPSYFENLKTEIGYRGENVMAFGFEPSVLMYNGFNTLDGYDSVHTLAWQQDFRRIIAPALAADEDDRSYYDNWGGRMYLFSSTLGRAPTRDKNAPATECLIDMDAFTEFGGKYILSRAEISNADALGLVLKGVYDDEGGIYRVHVYENPRVSS